MLGKRIELLLHRFAIGGPHFLLKRAALGRQCDELTAGIALVLLTLDAWKQIWVNVKFGSTGPSFDRWIANRILH